MKRRWLRRFAVVSSSVAIALAIDPLWAQQGAAGGEWRSYAGDLGATKYSPLSQIDARNFGTLRVVWRWQSADRFLSRTIPGRGEVWANASLTFDQLNKADPKRWREPDALRQQVAHQKILPGSPAPCFLVFETLRREAVLFHQGGEALGEEDAEFLPDLARDGGQ